jgi:hypothetical protein
VLGRRGGLKGGKALAAKRSPAEPSEAMRKAVRAGGQSGEFSGTEGVSGHVSVW